MVMLNTMPPMLCDSHTHLDQFPDEEVDAIVERAMAAGVGMIVCVGTTLPSCLRCIELAQRHDIIHAGVGLHPMDLKGPMCPEDRARLRDLAVNAPKVVCVGETGLDFLETSPDRRWQEQAFREHIRLARELGKPVDFHSREADDASLAILREENAAEAGVIWHYFQADAGRAREALEMGFWLSLAKPLLRIPELQEIARWLPMDRIVLETDTYPQPWKKHAIRRTEPSHVVQVAEKIAEIKGLTLDQVAAATTANLRRALKMD